jgi:ubiquitin-protein ligase
MASAASPPPADSLTLRQKQNYLAIEYKHLLSHSPGGVYLLPSLNTPGLFLGVIFLRRGLYQNGVYKFSLSVGPTYNDVNVRPKITFLTPLLNPLVDPATGELDLTGAFPTWDPERHYLITALTYLKKIFYLKTYTVGEADNRDFLGTNSSDITLPQFPNMEAVAMIEAKSYVNKVVENVRKSQESVYEGNGDNETFKFTKQPKSGDAAKGEEGAHDILRKLLYERGGDGDRIGADVVLECVKDASK